MVSMLYIQGCEHYHSINIVIFGGDVFPVTQHHQIITQSTLSFGDVFPITQHHQIIAQSTLSFGDVFPVTNNVGKIFLVK